MSHTKQRNTWWKVALRAGVSVAILALLLAMLPRERVWAAMGSVPVSLWLTVLAGYVAAHLIAVIKYRMMVNVAGAELRYPQAAQCYFGGLFGTLFLPSIIGGDLVRAGLGLRMARHRTGFLLGSLVDRLLDITALALVAGVGALLLPGELDSRHRRVFVGLLILGALVAAAAGAAIFFMPVRMVPFKLRRRLARLRQAARSMRRSTVTVLCSLLGGMLVQGSFATLTAVLAGACGLHLSVRVWWLAWPLAKIAALTPLTQGGLGVREAALAALLVPFGAPAAQSVAVGLLWQTIIYSGGLVAGALALVARRLSTATSTRAVSTARKNPATAERNSSAIPAVAENPSSRP